MIEIELPQKASPSAVKNSGVDADMGADFKDLKSRYRDLRPLPQAPPKQPSAERRSPEFTPGQAAGADGKSQIIRGDNPAMLRHAALMKMLRRMSGDRASASAMAACR
ncbi:MAG: hypothetical protein V7774_15450 [Pseudorhizobium pelagicum]|uniref:hypothetical protein n=1 Tax=Pseudorhizobium pelagicum TaxID=1509405 RepID=UPI00346148B1